MAMSGTWLKYEIVASPAFQALSATAIRVLLTFLMKRRIEKRPGRKRRAEPVILNNGEIEFTYKEALHKWGIKQSAFLDARDRLIDVGFLDIAKDGAGMYKSKTLYALSERWRRYGADDFEERERTKDRRRIGYQKRWGTKGKLP